MEEEEESKDLEGWESLSWKQCKKTSVGKGAGDNGCECKQFASEELNRIGLLSNISWNLKKLLSWNREMSSVPVFHLCLFCLPDNGLVAIALSPEFYTYPPCLKLYSQVLRE